MQGSSKILDDLALHGIGAGRISALAMDFAVHGFCWHGICVLAWERLETLPYHLGPLAVGFWCCPCCCGLCYGRRKEVGELKLLLQDLQEHVGAAPSEEQLDQLNEPDCAIAAQL